MENKPGPVKSTEKGLTRAEAKLDAGPETPGDAPHSSHSGLVQAVLAQAAKPLKRDLAWHRTQGSGNPVMSFELCFVLQVFRFAKDMGCW